MVIAGAWLWPTSRREGPEELALRPLLGVMRGPDPKPPPSLSQGRQIPEINWVIHVGGHLGALFVRVRTSGGREKVWLDTGWAASTVKENDGAGFGKGLRAGDGSLFVISFHKIKLH